MLLKICTTQPNHPHRRQGGSVSGGSRLNEVDASKTVHDSAEPLAQAQVLIDVQRLGPVGPFQAQLGQRLIDLLLAVPAAGQADERAAQVLAAVHVQVAQETAEAD